MPERIHLSGSERPRDGLLLMLVLWKLQGTHPVTITLADVLACQRAFPPCDPALLTCGPGDSVEVRVTSLDDARMRRAYEDAMWGPA